MNVPLREKLCLLSTSNLITLSTATTSKKNSAGSPASTVYVTTTLVTAGTVVGLVVIFIEQVPW